MRYRSVLRIVYTCSITGTDPVSIMSRFLDMQEVQKRLDYLKRSGMLTEDLEMTKKGRSALKVVLVGGAFDVIHHGHMHALNSAKMMGDVLVVVVASDNTAKTRKIKVIHNALIRRSLVSAIKVVDACVVGSDSGDIFVTVNTVKPDIIALGYDQAHRVADIEKGCRRLGLDGIRVVRLESPVPDVASSSLKNDISWDML